MAGRYQHHPRQLDPVTEQTNDFGIPLEKLPKLQQEFLDKGDLLQSVFGTPVSAKDFYRDVFPEDLIEDFENMEQHRPNGIASAIHSQKQRNRSYNRIIFNDLSTIEDLKDEQFVIVAPIGYSGRTRHAKNAYCMFGITIDLDYVSIKNLKNLMVQLQNDIVPFPSYIVNSGTGLHLYYLFENPIPLPGGREIGEASRLKKGLINVVWNGYTSDESRKQYQSVLQGYRMIGTQTKLGEEYRVTAYKGAGKITMRELNRYVDEKYQASYDDVERTTLVEAKELWPEWYERRVVRKEPVGVYTLNDREQKRRRAWYEAWKAKIKKGAYVGNRHNCCAVLFSYAYKAEIDLEEAIRDAEGLMDFFNALGTEKFTRQDMLDATRYYARQYIKLGREGIMDKTGIDIGVTKRKAKPDTRQVSLQKARAIQNIDDPEGNWRNKNGRPSKRDEVIEYINQHPEMNPTQIAKALGCSRPTVYKYMERKELPLMVDYVVRKDDEILGVIETDMQNPDEGRMARMQSYRDDFIIKFQKFMDELEEKE